MATSEDFEAAWEFFCEKAGVIAPRFGELYIEFSIVWMKAEKI